MSNEPEESVMPDVTIAAYPQLCDMDDAALEAHIDELNTIERKLRRRAACYYNRVDWVRAKASGLTHEANIAHTRLIAAMAIAEDRRRRGRTLTP